MSGLHITVAIATLGRPAELQETINQLRVQTRKPDCIIISATCKEDVPFGGEDLQIMFGSRGLCAQRNRAIEALPRGGGVLLFIDDDYLPSTRALERLERFFVDHPEVAGANGFMIADGIGGRDITSEEARATLQAYDTAPPPKSRVLAELKGLYGCNMAYRVAAINNVRFDERLPLYGWQEDIDFSAQVGRRGQLVKTNAWAGIHRGIKSARISGVRFGYSQIANPLYLKQKGTMSASFAYKLLARNFMANHVRALWPEPWVDRAGRVKGNWRALRDLMGGTLRPEAILDIS